jgi:hypothetical protein
MRASLCLQLDDLKQFRQWGSATPGHPENFVTAGVEVTTGKPRRSSCPGNRAEVGSWPDACVLCVQVPWARASAMLWAWPLLRLTWLPATTSPTPSPSWTTTREPTSRVWQQL